MIRATTDFRGLEEKLKQLTKDVNKTAEDSIIEMSIIGGRQLAHVKMSIRLMTT
jgi:hypothetical protein